MVLSLCIISTNLLTSELRSSRPGRRSFADVHVPSNLTFIEKDLIGGGVPGFTEKARSPKRYCMRWNFVRSCYPDNCFVCVLNSGRCSWSEEAPPLTRQAARARATRSGRPPTTSAAGGS